MLFAWICLVQAVAVLGMICDYDQIVYFGTGTLEIFYSIFDSNGTLSNPISITVGNTPTWLTVNEKENKLYIVNEEEGFLSSFHFSRQSGALSKINQVSNFGTATCHSQLDASHRWLGAVNYLTGNYALHKVNSDGSLVEDPVFSFQDDVAGGIAHPHQFLFSPDNRFIFVPDLGTDKIMQYEFNAEKEDFPVQPNRFQAYLTIAKGAGPRHLAFSPIRDTILFGSNELDSTLNVYEMNSDQGTLKLVQTVSTVLPSFNGTNYPAEVVTSRCGRYVYVSNRGDNSIAKFRVILDEVAAKESDSMSVSGVRVSLESVTPCGGDWPRFIGFDKSYEYMFSTNQNSNNVAIFSVNEITGELLMLRSVPMPSPQHALFISN